MSDPIYDEGMEVRREVLGDEHVDRAIERTTRVHRAVPGLHHPLRVGRGLGARRASTAAPAARHAGGADRARARARARDARARRAAQRALTATEIGEVLLHTAVYAGVPAANRAFAIADEVLREEPPP